MAPISSRLAYPDFEVEWVILNHLGYVVGSITINGELRSPLAHYASAVDASTTVLKQAGYRAVPHYRKDAAVIHPHLSTIEHTNECGVRVHWVFDYHGDVLGHVLRTYHPEFLYEAYDVELNSHRVKTLQEAYDWFLHSHEKTPSS